MNWNRGVAWVAFASMLVACDGGGGGETDAGVASGGDGGSSPASPTQIRTDAPIQPALPESSDLMGEAIASCQRLIAGFEPMVVERCSYSPSTSEIVDGFAQLHADAVASRPLPGRGLEAYALPPGEITLAGDAIEILSCTVDPLCSGGACPSMNAFATTNLVVTQDPLFASFAEGAAYWGLLVEDAGGDPDAVDADELFEGLGAIYAAQARGERWRTVDEATVSARIAEDPFTNDRWVEVMAFLVFHEIGHSDLGHSIVNHTAAVGPGVVLEAEGRTLTAEETQQLQREIRELKVFTETQADIYAATLLREAGLSAEGPIVLFTGAMAAYLIASGACSASMTQAQLFECALQRQPNASHPPLDVRATVLHRIVEQGEDLTPMLEAITP